MFDYDSQSAEPRPSGSPGGGFGLTSMPGAIWRRKWWPVGLAVAFAAAAALYTTTLIDRYTATAQVFIDPRELRVLNTEVTPNTLNSDSTTAFLESQARIIASPNMLRRIVDREALVRDPEFAGSKSVLSRLFPPRADGDHMERVAERLSRNLWVRRGERTFVIDIAVTAATPEKASRLANAFAAAYLEDQANARSDIARRTTGALTSRLDELRDRVRQSEDKVETYKNQKNIVGASGKLVNEEQLAAVNSQLAFARSRTADAKAKLDQLDSVRGQAAERGALPEALNSQTLGILRQQLGEAQRRVANLNTQLGPLHPDFQSARSALLDAQRSVADEITRIRSAARAELDRAVGNERAIAAQVEMLKRETLSTGRDTVQLRELERELEANRAIYQSFLQRARETGEQERVDTTNARIITTAVPPLDRTGPPRRFIVTGAAFGGFALGILAALGAGFLEALRRGQRIPEAPPAAAAIEGAGEPAAPVEPQPQPGMRPMATPSLNQRPTSSDDLVRLLGVLGQLEQAIRKHGMPR